MSTSATHVFDYYLHSKAEFYLDEDDFKKKYTVEDFLVVANWFRKALSDLWGDGPIGPLAIYGSNSLQWEAAQLAILTLKGIVVGLDVLDSPSRMNEMMEEYKINGIVFLTFSSSTFPTLAEEARRGLSAFKCLICEDQFSEILFRAREARIQPLPIRHYKDTLNLSAQDPATILFTSGTTGKPKAIQYSHQQIICAIDCIQKVYQNYSKDLALVSWMPLSNLYQRMINAVGLSLGAQIYYIKDPAKIAEKLPRCSPTFFVSVPRFFERIREQVYLNISKSPWVLRKILYWSLEMSESRRGKIVNQSPVSLLERFGFWTADALVFRKIKSLFGNRLRILASGSALLRSNTENFFEAAGLPICQAYGVSENTVPIALSTPKKRKHSRVGFCPQPNEVQISAEGEVMVKGPGVFKGYLHRKQEGIFEGEFYKTGDLGFIDSDGFLFLEGRKNDVFKLSTGKKVHSNDVLSTLGEINEIDQCTVLGEGQNLRVLLITTPTLSLEELRNVKKQDLVNRVRSSLSRVTSQQRPVGLIWLNRHLNPITGETTTNLKIRQSFLNQKFSGEIEEILDRVQRGDPFPVVFEK